MTCLDNLTHPGSPSHSRIVTITIPDNTYSMTERRCAKCKQLFPNELFTNASGKLLKTCLNCRGKCRAPGRLDPVAERPTPRVALRSRSPNAIFPRKSSRSVSPAPSRDSSISSVSGTSTLRAGPQPFSAPASTVTALESRINSRMGNIEAQLSQLLTAVKRISAPTQTPSFVLPPAQPPTIDTTNSAQLPSGESVVLPSARFFPWVPKDIITAVALDKLKPERLVALRNPESRVTRKTLQQSSVIVSDGQFRLAEESGEAKVSSFVKAIPNVRALTQVWIVYTSIRFSYTQDFLLAAALLSHLESIVEFDATYHWKAVAEYHLAVCRQRFGTGVVDEWGCCYINLQMPTPPKWKFAFATTLAPAAMAAAECTRRHSQASTASNSAIRARTAPNSASMARTAPNSASTHAAPAASFPLLGFFAPQGIVDMAPDSAAALLASLLTGPPPQERPNTSCDLPIFDSSDSPATNGSLKLEHWSHFLDLYPDQAFAQQLCGALRHGVKLDYDGPLRHYARLEVSNLPINPEDELHLHQEIDARLLQGRLRPVHNPASNDLVCSPVSVVPKPHSVKRRTIYHLSHPRKPGSRLPSVNAGIHPSFVSIQYENLDVIVLGFAGRVAADAVVSGVLVYSAE
ncbi:uncharacterized protein UBRO2_05287 [Ustilago bromivora]|uniref:Uncharacterized protein n=1 Tax=Ustilago bromivora TaxID=307758 RepID=A0A8H8QRH3_9BASI|nr:uncharacterized protein UBRO2_05287 [Ustilago bromivora]